MLAPSPCGLHGRHRELASYVLRQVLQLEGHPTNSQIAAAVKQRNAGLAPAGGAIKRPLEPVIKQEQVSSKIMRVFAPQVATGQADSSPEISWPPCVSVKVSAGTDARGDTP